MIESKRVESQPLKLLAGGAVKLRLALGSCLVLTVGAWLAPPTAQTKIAAPQEHAAPLLEEQVQLREVSRPFVGVQEAATPVSRYSVAVLLPLAPTAPVRNDYSEFTGPVRDIAGFGVLISDMHVLTHSAALNGRTLVDLAIAGGRTASARVATYELSTGLVLLELERSAERASAPFAVQAPTSGELAVAVGRSRERELAVPVFVTSAAPDSYTIGAVSDGLSPGMPVFNLAGELLTIAVPDGPAFRGVPVRDAVERLLTHATTGERPSSFGLGIQALSEPLSQVFGSGGIIISEVLPGGPGDLAGIQVGDVLLAVGDLPIDSEATCARALAAAAIDTPVTVRVRRGTRASDIQVTPKFAYEIAALARSRAVPSAGLEAAVLFPPATLESSAIPPSARVLSVSGRALTTRAQVQRELRLARRPVPVLIRDGNSQFFVAVEPMP